MVAQGERGSRAWGRQSSRSTSACFRDSSGGLADTAVSESGSLLVIPWSQRLVSPIRSSSPTRSARLRSTLAPFTKVPFALSRSVTNHDSATSSSSACRRDTALSQSMVMSFSGLRPMVR